MVFALRGKCGEPHLMAKWFGISCLIGKKKEGRAPFFMAVFGRGKCGRAAFDGKIV